MMQTKQKRLCRSATSRSTATRLIGAVIAEARHPLHLQMETFLSSSVKISARSLVRLRTSYFVASSFLAKNSRSVVPKFTRLIATNSKSAKREAFSSGDLYRSGVSQKSLDRREVMCKRNVIYLLGECRFWRLRRNRGGICSCLDWWGFRPRWSWEISKTGRFDGIRRRCSARFPARRRWAFKGKEPRVSGECSVLWDATPTRQTPSRMCLWVAFRACELIRWHCLRTCFPLSPKVRQDWRWIRLRIHFVTVLALSFLRCSNNLMMYFCLVTT